MSQMPSKVDISVGVPSSSKKFYVQDHITTHGFMQMRPIFIREYVPKRNMAVKVQSFVRANPMPVPIFGRCRINNRAFFVPYRTVWKCYNEFYAQTLYNFPSFSAAVPTATPYILNSEFITWFITASYGLSTEVPSSTPSDFKYLDNAMQTRYFQLTEKGIKILTIIESLGYKINFNAADTFEHPALPFLCYLKVLVDWYYPSAYVGSSLYNTISAVFNNPVDNANIGVGLLNCLSDLLYCTYESDYFVNAWDNPTGPNNLNVIGQYQLSDVTGNSVYPLIVTNSNGAVANPASSIQTNNGTPFVGSNNSTGGNAANGVFTQYVLDALKSLTDYTKRHQLSGVRLLDRYLTELGISLSNEIANRSCYLGSDSFNMEFYDVFNHSNTYDPNGGNPIGSPLGTYAGKGNGFSGNKVFNYENGKEFGMFIIINTIIPEVGYYQGQHREMMHRTALDFYHPDFDHMGVQAIKGREVYVSQDGSLGVSSNNINSHIFGFAPRYIEYNTPMDQQTGLYRVQTRSKLLPSYSLMRDLSFFENGTLAQMKHTIGFVQGSDQSQYLRIFYESKIDEDNFNAIHHFEVTQYDSTLPAYDTYEFDEQNENIKLDVNGSKLN